LPERLSELVPDFLSEVPEDPYTGQALKYKVDEDGYAVYSVGPDLTDDGGDDVQKAGQRHPPDFVFRVAFPE
jgi:hypothetical protein